MRQPVFVISKYHLMLLIVKTIEKGFYGLNYGKSSALEMFVIFTDMNPTDSNLNISKVANILRDLETDKMPARANSAIDWIITEMNRHRIATYKQENCK